MPEPEQKPRTAEGPQEGRLLSLAPTLTETLFAIGAGPRLVGRSDYCRQPASAEALPSFGTALTPQLESIARLQPSRVLVQQTSQPVSDLTALAPVSQLPWSSVDEVVASIRRLGKLTDRRQAADKLARDISAQLRATDRKGAPRALLLLGLPDERPAELWFVKENSLHGAALRAAGLRNAVADRVTGAPTISLERLIALDPDMILVMVAQNDPQGLESRRIQRFMAGIPGLRAVRERRVAVLAGEAYFSEGPGLVDLVEALRGRVRAMSAGENSASRSTPTTMTRAAKNADKARQGRSAAP